MRSQLVIIVCATVLTSCRDMNALETSAPSVRLRDISASQWQALARTRVFFGHQSVGRNIVDGMRELIGADGLPLTIVQSLEPGAVAQAAFVEGMIGKNGDPRSKTRDFAVAVAGMAGTGGIAFHKYCYVDINEHTDVDRMFAEYRSSMQQLRAQYPRVSFVHVTIPLTVQPPFSARHTIKVLLGRESNTDTNVQRNRFNRMLLQEYAGKEPIFDVARLESTRADGTRVFHTKRRERIYTLATEWASDEGHLNGAGRRAVGEQLLVFLAQLASAPTRTAGL